jgi:formylglycine-generating enzyme required for sulfatase activity
MRFPHIIAAASLVLLSAGATGHAENPVPLTAAQERALKPKDTFQECDNCPEMVVVPAGAFTMGSPKDEKNHWVHEGPQRVVTIGKAFAVGKLHVTRDQYAVFARETGYAAHSKCGWRSPGFTQ